MNYMLRVLSYYIFDFQIPIKAVNLMHLSANLTQVGLYSACPAHLVKMTESLILGYAVQVKISGYAASGCGRGIERVDVYVDGCKTLMEAARSQKQVIHYIADDANSDKWA
jgi:hypothetical protein